MQRNTVDVNDYLRYRYIDTISADQYDKHMSKNALMLHFLHEHKLHAMNIEPNGRCHTQ